MKSCFLFGHQDAPESVRALLVEVIERHITEYGVREFVVGRRGAFDGMAGRTLAAAKKHHPEILLLDLLAYHPSQRDPGQRPGFDGTFYPPGMETVPRPYAIVRANRYMVAHTDALIVYVRDTAGNSAKLLNYARNVAKKNHMTIENLADCHFRGDPS